MLKQSQAKVLQKTQMLAANIGGARATGRPHGSMVGSRMGDRRTAPFLTGDRVENRLKKPTTFICKMKFRNELPDPTAQPKLLVMNTNKDRYTKYTITSLEKIYKPKLYPETDLGIPLDLLDISVYNRPAVCPPLAPEDEELLRDAEVETPVKQGGIRKKDRPTEKGVSWLVNTEYISSFSLDTAKTSMSEKQAKEMRQSREGRNQFLENLNSREKQIQAIEESFKASNLPPVHQTNRSLKPVKIMPLLPDFERYDDRFVMASFDGAPTADAEMYNKLDRSIRDAHESQAIMKSFVVNGSDPSKSEKFLAFMAPAPDELSKDMYDENEDISYCWVREYHWDVRGDDVDDPTTFLVNFDDHVARYLPLPTKLLLKKKKAKEGRSSDEVEQYPVPLRITVRKRASVAVTEVMESGQTAVNYDRADIHYSKKARSFREDYSDDRPERTEHFSGDDDISE
ncbi:protein PAF1 homolog [Phalaenopsis equestris]|uniref:protein PAF1 homolog n=1 Tax=Phalaenopsis equestris TaxID=78828 RepID=UPI0009E50F34|nr:protein PAF1 homolog [Phalaenopsis equestris]